MSDNELMNASASVDLRDLEIETFEVESLTDLGIVAAVADMESVDVTIASTSSTTSSTCCG